MTSGVAPRSIAYSEISILLPLYAIWFNTVMATMT